MASIHDKLSRVRKPRVHISYEVETEGAMVERELPFVVGVLGGVLAAVLVLVGLAAGGPVDVARVAAIEVVFDAVTPRVGGLLIS